MGEKEETSKALEIKSRSDQIEQPIGAEQAENVQEEVTKDARLWSMFCHLAGLAWLLWWIVPLVGGVIGTLILWQIKKEEHLFIDEHGKEAFNFQTSMLIYGVIAGLLCSACVGFVLLPAVMIVDIVFGIIAAVKANKGEPYRYPVSIRFIK